MLLSHNKKSTSAGLKYLESTSTIHFPVALSYHFSSTHSHFHSISTHTSSKLQFTKSLTLLDSHVEIQKSSGSSCCNIIHIHST